MRPAIAWVVIGGALAPVPTGCSRGGGPSSVSDGPPTDVAPTDVGAGSDTAPADDTARDAPPDAATPFEWSPIAGAECGLVYAMNPATAPPRSWEDCGGGCQTARIPRFGHAQGFVFATAAVTTGGETYLRLYMGPGAGWFGAVEIVRLSDGVAIAVVEQRDTTYPCGVTNWASSAALVLPIHSKAGYSALWFTTAAGAPPRASKVFAEPAVSKSAFAVGGGVGWTFDDGRVLLAARPDASSLLLVDETGSVDRAVGRGDQGFWLAGGGMTDGAIRGFRLGSSAEAFVAVKDRAASLSVSDERLAWVAVHGPQAWLGDYASAEIAWSPRPDRPADVTVADSVPIGASRGLRDLQIGGDYAAVTGCAVDGADCALFVLQFASKKTWRIRPMPGRVYTGVVQVTGSDVIVAEASAPLSLHAKEAERLVRLRTASLDDLAKRW